MSDLEVLGRGTVRRGQLVGWVAQVVPAPVGGFYLQYTRREGEYFDSWAETLDELAAYGDPRMHDIEWTYLSDELRQAVEAYSARASEIPDDEFAVGQVRWRDIVRAWICLSKRPK